MINEDMFNRDDGGNSSSDAREQFNRQAAEYATSTAHSGSESLSILKALAVGRRYSKALDIATGPGFTAFAVAEFCDSIVASDVASGMLDQARKIAAERGVSNVEFQIIDAHAIHYDDDSLDLVTCRTAPHHFRDIPLFLQEVRRVLRVDGVFLLSDTTTSENPESARWHQRVEAVRDPTHVNAPPPSEWRRLIAEAGFEVVDTVATRVDMKFTEWVERSGTPDEAIHGLFSDFATAAPDVAEEFRIEEVEHGSDFSFSWPVFVCRAEKLRR